MRRPTRRLIQDLEELRRRFGEGHLATDPVRYPHRYDHPADREVVGFLAAGLAFGRVASIFQVLDRLLERLGAAPAEALVALAAGRGPDLTGLRHRWLDGEALRVIGVALGAILRRHGSLAALFASLEQKSEPPARAIQRFVAALRAEAPAPSRAVRFFFAAPEGTTAGKRINLFLRWVARPADGIDLGIWTRPTPDRLLMPVDTHVAFLGYALGLSATPRANLLSVEQITEAFRRVDAGDPVKYDWALSRIGILGSCRHRRSEQHCRPCPLLAHCRL